MNPQDPLAGLHPLREPLPVGWWPPAPGWWVLAALVLFGLLALFWLLRRRYHAGAYRRQALARLDLLRAGYARENDSISYLAGANALLKSVALHAYPRRDVAGCSGPEWLKFLNSALGQAEQFPDSFVTGAYRKDSTAIDVDRLHRSATLWIRQHGVKA